MVTKNATTFFLSDSDAWKKVRPYQIDNLAPAPGIKMNNLEKEEHELPLTDIRTSDFKPNIDEHGFEFISRPSKLCEHVLEDHELVKYGSETIPIIQKMFGTDDVYCFNMRVRKAPLDGATTVTAPVHEAHFDVSTEDGWSRHIGTFTSEEAAKFASGKWRMRVINLWRPLQDVVEDDSLAYCDPNTVDFENDMIPGNRVGPGYCTEIGYLKYNKEQKWYWMSKMHPDQIAVFTTYDSHPPNGKLNFVAHAAFKNWNAPEGCSPRKSIETRNIVLTPAPYEAPVIKELPIPELEQPWRQWINTYDLSAVRWTGSSERVRIRTASQKAIVV